MTPAAAMHEALWKSFAKSRAWPTDPEDVSRWTDVAEQGLAEGRAGHSLGLRGIALAQHVAAALNDAYWRVGRQHGPDQQDRAREIERHWSPAAEALIASARQPQSAA